MSTTAQAVPTRTKTGKVRFSYAQQLYQPQANDKGAMKYGVTLLIPKSDAATYAAMCAAAEACKRRAVSGKDDAFYKVHPRTLHDGDGVKPTTGEAYGPECKGHWVVAVSCNDKPLPGVNIVSANPAFNPSADKINSGDYGKASLNAYWFDTGTNKGVTFGLNNVLFLERGERIDGRTAGTDDFADELGAMEF